MLEVDSKLSTIEQFWLQIETMTPKCFSKVDALYKSFHDCPFEDNKMIKKKSMVFLRSFKQRNRLNEIGCDIFNQRFIVTTFYKSILECTLMDTLGNRIPGRYKVHHLVFCRQVCDETYYSLVKGKFKKNNGNMKNG